MALVKFSKGTGPSRSLELCSTWLANSVSELEARSELEFIVSSFQILFQLAPLMIFSKPNGIGINFKIRSCRIDAKPSPRSECKSPSLAKKRLEWNRLIICSLYYVVYLPMSDWQSLGTARCDRLADGISHSTKLHKDKPYPDSQYQQGHRAGLGCHR